jgi:putative flippase GtrA
MVRLVLDRLHAITFLRYIGASGFALAADMGLFLLLLGAGLLAPAASAISYTVGIGAHWLVSSRLVFAEGAAPSGAERWRQKFLFLLSAFVGLALTVAIVTLGDMAGFDPRLAKLAAIGVSFVATYILRKSIVFAVR